MVHYFNIFQDKDSFFHRFRRELSKKHAKHTKNAYLPCPRDLAGKTGVYGISRIRHTAGWEKIALCEQQEKAVSSSAGCKTTAT